VLDPTPLSPIGSFTGPDTLQAANSQDPLLPPDFLGHQSAPTPYQPFAEQSFPLQETSMTHNSSFLSMEMVAGQSSQSQNWDFSLTGADDSPLSPLTIGSERGLGDASCPPESPSAVASNTTTQATEHQLRQRRDSLADSQPENNERHTNKRKRMNEPKDPTAARRLRRQREIDDENIKTLEDLFIPKNAEPVMKKQRLSRGTAPHLFFCKILE
jgi:hypothetical protein